MKSKMIVITLALVALLIPSMVLASSPANYTMPGPAVPPFFDIEQTPKKIDVNNFEELERLGLRAERLPEDWQGLNYHALANGKPFDRLVFERLPKGTPIWTDGVNKWKADCGNLLIDMPHFGSPMLDCIDGGNCEVVDSMELEELKWKADSYDELMARERDSSGLSLTTNSGMKKLAEWLFWALLVLALLLAIAWLLWGAWKWLMSRDDYTPPSRPRGRTCTTPHCSRYNGVFSDAQVYCDGCNNALYDHETGQYTSPTRQPGSRQTQPTPRPTIVPDDKSESAPSKGPKPDVPVATVTPIRPGQSEPTTPEPIEQQIFICKNDDCPGQDTLNFGELTCPHCGSEVKPRTPYPAPTPESNDFLEEELRTIAADADNPSAERTGTKGRGSRLPKNKMVTGYKTGNHLTLCQEGLSLEIGVDGATISVDNNANAQIDVVYEDGAMKVHVGNDD